MLIEEREIGVAHLRPGMYVSRLDRDWIGTPFLLQGFLVQTQDDIDLLAQYCRHVFVDTVKSENFVRNTLQRLEKPARIVASHYEMPTIAALVNSRPRPVTRKVEEELPRVQEAVRTAQLATADLVSRVRPVAAGWSDSGQAVTRWWKACCATPTPILARAMRHHDSYTYSHAMNCCALMASFGRHLGLGDSN